MIETTTHKHALELALTALTEELKSIGIADPQNPHDWIAVPEGVDANEADPDLVADVVEEWDERQALVATLERQYNNIIRALEKIQNGTYGTCEICNQPIDEGRLAILPEARTCRDHMDSEGTLSL